MAREAVLDYAPKPEGYKPPKWEDVAALQDLLEKRRQAVINRIWEVKKIRRGEWSDVIRVIPKAYRQMLVSPDLPVVRDMLQRVSGLISKHEPMPQVIPISPRPEEVRKAAKEEARLNAVRIQIEDQQDRPVYAMGIDAQAAWGESWISVLPDPRRLMDPEYKRGDDEDGKAYSDRYAKTMLKAGIPIRLDDHDPQSVLPYWAQGSLPLVIIKTEHQVLDINLGLGYKPIVRARGDHPSGPGEIVDWARGTLSEGYVPNDMGTTNDISDPTHVTHYDASGVSYLDRKVTSTVYLDQWTYQRYLGGILVEQWEHDHGCVPIFPAYGEQSSDRDPAYQSMGIADAAISLARQVVLFAAVMASNAMQHGFPTPFLSNPAQGLVHPVTGEPLVRKVQLGEMNVLAQGEEISFPYLDAKMMPDFYRHLDWLTTQLEGATLSNFGKAIGSDIAGYAIAQIRSMQMSILTTIYTNAARQWRKIYYFIRHLVRTKFPGGIYMRGAVEEEATDDGGAVAYSPVLEFAKEDTTENQIQVTIDEGIAQDEIAEKKMAIELVTAGLWSPRRGMEATGVEDPEAEDREIRLHRLINMPQADEIVLGIAAEIAAKRWAAAESLQQTAFARALEQAKQQVLGAGGTQQNQGAFPQNTTGGGVPINQQPGQTAPGGGQPGAAGPPPQAATRGPSISGVPTTPGGANGVTQVPVGAPG